METKYLTVSSKNQITLNRDVRDILKIQAGDKVYFENTNYGVLFKKLENIYECPICNGEKTFFDNKCLICDGLGMIKDEITSELIVAKLVNILLVNGSNIDIKKNNDFGYIINSTSNDEIVAKYIEECQKFIIKNSLSKFIDEKLLISKETKDEYTELFIDKIDRKDLLKLINNVQLNVIKNMLKDKSTITKAEYDMFVDSFNEEYQDKVSKFLLTFVEL